MAKKNNKANSTSLSIDELRAKSNELEENIFKLRMQLKTGQLANTSLLRLARKDLARVKTAVTQREAGRN